MYEKLVLIIPPSPWLISDTDLPSLGVLYISSYLKANDMEVDVCDLSGLDESQWKIPIGDVYGITGTSPNFLQIKKIVERLKEREPEKLVVVGGAHATTLHHHILKNTLADACVIGEGEHTMLDIMHDPLEQICGIVYREKDTIHKNPKRYLIKDLDDLPFPDWEAVDFYKYAKSQTFKYVTGECLEATILTGRGCPYKCSFCSSNSIWQGKVRFRRPEHIINEMMALQASFGVELFYFIDDTFVLDKDRVQRFCELVKPHDMKWHCLNRVDRCDVDTLQMMKDAGCLQIVLGFESGSDEILKKSRKGTTVAHALQAIENIKKVGMKIRGQLIVGLPGETSETILATADFIRTAKEVDTFGLHVFQPFPGCDIWSYPELYDYEIDRDTDFSDYHTIGKPGLEFSVNRTTADGYIFLKDIINERSIERM